MPIHRRSNQYRGINAHLHSYLQAHNAWSVFHGEHITHLRTALQDQLPPETGYFVVSERSLQITRDDLLTGDFSLSRSIPDVGIYKSGEGEAKPTEQTIAIPGAEVSILDTFSEPENVTGVVIYSASPDETGLGQPVTRLELLSPANKPPGSHYRQYLAKRSETLQAGVNLVELDYLHERRSTLPVVADYTKRHSGAYPYVILSSRPYPSLAEGKTAIYGFRVDDPIPTIEIPLLKEESVILDLDTVYQHTFESNLAYGLRFVDYDNLPENVDAYDDTDKQRIQAVMTRTTQKE